MWLSDHPGDGLAFRLDWIEQRSFANELPACMYAGARKRDDGSLEGWRELGSMQEVVDDSLFAVKQDVRLLNEHIVEYTVERMLPYVRARHPLQAADVDWFLPHYSSQYFRDRLAEGLRRVDFEILHQPRHIVRHPGDGVGAGGGAALPMAAQVDCQCAVAIFVEDPCKFIPRLALAVHHMQQQDCRPG